MKSVSARRSPVLILSAFIAALLGLAPAAWSANGTWLNTGATDGNWSTASNWVSGTIPGATSGITNADIATFNTAVGTFGTSASPIVIDANRNIRAINFATGAGSYCIGSTGGNPLLLSDSGFIQILNTLTSNSTENVNAPLILEGSSYSFISGSANGILNFGGTITGVATTGNVTLLNLTGSNTNANTISGSIGDGNGGGQVGLAKFGTGTWKISGVNTYTGITNIHGGTLEVTAGSAIGSSTAPTNVGDNNSENGTLSITGGAVSSYVGTIGNGAGSSGTTTVSGGTWTVATGLYVGGSGTGVLIVEGGIVYNNQTFIGNSAGSMGTATVSSGTWTNNGALHIGVSGTGVLNITDTGITNVVGINGSGTVTIGDSSTGSGTLNLGSGGAAGTLNAATVTGGSGTAVVNFNQTGNYTFAPALTGNLNVNKFGTGTTTLTGANNYTGATIVNGGTLANSGGSLTTGAVVVNSSGTFTNSANLTLTGAPGVAGNGGGTFVQNSTGTLDVQIDGAGNGQFGHIVAGTVSLGGTLNVTLAPGFQPGNNDSYQIFSTNSRTGAFNNGSNIVQVGSRYFKVSYTNTGVIIQPTAVITCYHQAGGGVNFEGHAFISLTRKTGAIIVAGFYCKDYKYFIDVPEVGFSGEIDEDAFTPWDYKITYPISDAQLNAALAVYAHDSQSPPNYTLIGFNCMSWVLKVATAAGVQLPQTNYPGLPLVDPYNFGISLQAIGDGGSFMGGIVSANATPNGESSAVPSASPVRFDYSYTGLESAGHSNPAALAAAIGIEYEHVNLGNAVANNISGLSLNLAGTDANRSLISIDWGDGSSFQQQSLTFSHIYGVGSYTAHLLVIDSGAVHYYDLAVVVSPSTATAVNVQVTPVAPVSIPNQGLVPATLGPDFLIMQAVSVSISANGHAVASFLGIPTVTYTIQSTGDLSKGFSTIGTATADSNGNFQYDDAAAVGTASRFYRATYP